MRDQAQRSPKNATGKGDEAFARAETVMIEELRLNERHARRTAPENQQTEASRERHGDRSGLGNGDKDESVALHFQASRRRQIHT